MVAPVAGLAYNVPDGIAFSLASAEALTEGFTPNHVVVKRLLAANGGKVLGLTVTASIIGTDSTKTWTTPAEKLPVWLTKVLLDNAAVLLDPVNKGLRIS